MKPLYSNQNKRSSLRGTLVIVMMVSVVIFALDTLSGGFVRSYARTIGAVAWNAGAGVVRGIDRSGLLATRASLVAENEELKAEISERDEEALRFKMLEDENILLRELAHLAGAQAGVSARVISSFYASPYGTFRLDAGTQSGVRVGDAVMTAGGFVLGVVTDVDLYSATAESLFAPEKKTELLLGDVRFESEGRGGGNGRAELPRDIVVAVGDVALAPVYGSRAAAIVGKIDSASSSASQTVYMRSPQNFSSLRIVYVVHQ